jgi:hypothetical protein
LPRRSQTYSVILPDHRRGGQLTAENAEIAKKINTWSEIPHHQESEYFVMFFVLIFFAFFCGQTKASPFLGLNILVYSLA